MTGGSGPPKRPLSLSEVHGTVQVPVHPSFWRRLFAFAGPAYLVSVGYMDPGNWATDIAAGSRFGYALIWVLLMSNIMAILLQSLSARLGIVAGMDLAQACRVLYHRRGVSISLWILAEVAIVACDLAEVLGAAIGLQLLFGFPLLVGVSITAFDALVLLGLQSRGMRMMEAFILALVSTIGVCLGIEVLLSHPEWGQMASGFVPQLPGAGALYLAIGMLGATVMPHNLYLHSALVQSRRIRRVPSGIRSGIRFNVIDSVVALNSAFFVNAALLVMAAAVFFRAGVEVVEIQDAHRLLEPILGVHLAPIVFAIALIASGQSSTITGTLAGQIVMEGFVQIRVRPVARRLLTRALAIIPAVVTIILFGERTTGDLLVLSQVVLSLQLSFAVIPLIHLVCDRRHMGVYRIGAKLQVASWLVAGVIAALNLWLAWEEVRGWLFGGGGASVWVWLTVVPAGAYLVGLLAYVTFWPLFRRVHAVEMPPGVHGPLEMPPLQPPRTPRRIAAAVDFTSADGPVLSHAVSLSRSAGRHGLVVLLHVVESGGVRLLGKELGDHETETDRERLELYAAELAEQGVAAEWDLGFGEPVDQLIALVHQHRPDIVVLGSHGHRAIGDFIKGTSVDRLRHRLDVPVLVVPSPDGPTEPDA